MSAASSGNKVSIPSGVWLASDIRLRSTMPRGVPPRSQFLRASTGGIDLLSDLPRGHAGEFLEAPESGRGNRAVEETMSFRLRPFLRASAGQKRHLRYGDRVVGAV